MSISIDPERVNIRDDAWELVEVTEDYIRHRAPMERYADGNVLYVYRTIPRGLDEALDANRRAYDDSQGKRFRDDYTRVASIPTNVLFDPKTQIAEKLREGDRDHLKWFINRDECKPWRTFRGKV
jgi:hypothetical protein